MVPGWGCDNEQPPIARTLDPLQFVLMAMAGRMNQRQQQVIEYLQEENRVLREQTGKRRLRFTDDQRPRLAVEAKQVGWMSSLAFQAGLAPFDSHHLRHVSYRFHIQRECDDRLSQLHYWLAYWL